MAKKKTTTESKSKKGETQSQLSGLKSLFAETGISWETPRLRTGIIPLDYVLGGGWGYGRLGEIYGGHSSSKTYILYRSLIACQQMGGTAILLETEGAYDPQWFERLGGNDADLVKPPVLTTQDVFSTIDKILDFASGKPDAFMCIGWDSIAATPTTHLMDKGIETTDMSRPKVISQGCELITTKAKKKNVCILATNQTRSSMDKYKPDVTPGGVAWPFHSSQRVELKFDGGKTNHRIVDDTHQLRKEDDPEIIGRRITAYVEKNKLGPACRTVELPFYLYDGRKHPIYNDRATVLGFDDVEALFDFYHHGPFQLKPTDPDKKPWEGPRVVAAGAPGWFLLDPQVDPDQKQFRKGDWPSVLEAFPRLKTLPFEEGPGA